jgi:hypothetical protein
MRYTALESNPVSPTEQPEIIGQAGAIAVCGRDMRLQRFACRRRCAAPALMNRLNANDFRHLRQGCRTDANPAQI